MEATGWLFKMVSLLGTCGFKLHGIFILFYQIFVSHVSSKENIIFISFHKKYDVMMTSPLHYDKAKNSNCILHIFEMPK